MGKSLKGKELGKGISQRKDGLYQARFINRFGKRQTIYAKTYSDITKKLRDAQYEDEKQINVVTSNMTLDEWYNVWMTTCKTHCINYLYNLRFLIVLSQSAQPAEYHKQTFRKASVIYDYFTCTVTLTGSDTFPSESVVVSVTA